MVAKTPAAEDDTYVVRLGSETSHLPFETVVRNSPSGSFEVLDERGRVCGYFFRPVEPDPGLAKEIEEIWRDNPEELRRRQREVPTGRTTAEVFARLRALDQNGGECECPSP